ncbi:hypothetical protein PUNSTDRAFT_129436 [Punctularia strigosozonata HHB-11173 SS5]|uniref:uncharacterized protein n=1 Tax=Punctularia strigosozonata (strain HHB-11173) TaxID=741275 RepID=UPI0004416986|nr:uncharacterized protein PUNSTDRAFT_129436 [Punctularia strigosozonata HHB-11173 SS5]EIN13766.1 hypothetical protein PUNSTDRAFT_129436 [Punctularia strigosozonata HHB-11173 SS5]
MSSQANTTELFSSFLGFMEACALSVIQLYTLFWTNPEKRITNAAQSPTKAIDISQALQPMTPQITTEALVVAGRCRPRGKVTQPQAGKPPPSKPSRPQQAPSPPK